MRASAASRSMARVLIGDVSPLFLRACCSAALLCCRACSSMSNRVSPDAARQRSAQCHFPCDIAPRLIVMSACLSCEISGGAQGE